MVSRKVSAEVGKISNVRAPEGEQIWPRKAETHPDPELR